MIINNEQYLFREPFVLLTIIYLSSLTQTPMEKLENVVLHTKSGQGLKLWIFHVVIPVPGIILVALLSKILGRRFALKILCALTVISSFMKLFPWFTDGTNVIQSITTGGVLATTSLAIAEYSTPKHRLAYLIGNTVARETVGHGTSYIVGKWLPVFECGMGLMCLASVCTWPETPYWLASKGMRDEGRAALLWLRKNNDSAHRELRYFADMPGPIPWPMIFWQITLPFVAIWVSQLAYGHYYMATSVYDGIPTYIVVMQRCGIICLLSTIIYCSYKSKRNTVYYFLAWISLATYYLVIVFLGVILFHYIDNLNIILLLLYFCNTLIYCGIYVLMNAIHIEIMPLEFNTLISCSCALIVNLSPLVLLHMYPTRNIEIIGISTFLVMPLALCGVTVVYKFAPKTYNKNLLEIQESCIPESQNATPERNQFALENMTNFCNTGAIHLQSQY